MLKMKKRENREKRLTGRKRDVKIGKRDWFKRRNERRIKRLFSMEGENEKVEETV